MTMCHTFHPRSLFKFIVAHIFPTWLMDEDEVAQHSPLFYKWPIINMVRETGYMHLHATKPDTLG